MKCSSCKSDLNQESKFCPECGTAVPKPVPVQKVSEPKVFPPILNVKEAAEFLTISTPHLYTLIRNDDLPWFPIGTHKRFLTEELIAWAKKRMRGGDNIVSQADAGCHKVAN